MADVLQRLHKFYIERRNDYDCWAKEVEAAMQERDDLNNLVSKLSRELNETVAELEWYQRHSLKRLESQAAKQGLQMPKEEKKPPEPPSNRGHWISIKNPKTGHVELVEAPENKK